MVYHLNNYAKLVLKIVDKTDNYHIVNLSGKHRKLVGLYYQIWQGWF